MVLFRLSEYALLELVECIFDLFIFLAYLWLWPKVNIQKLFPYVHFCKLRIQMRLLFPLKIHGIQRLGIRIYIIKSTKNTSKAKKAWRRNRRSSKKAVYSNVRIYIFFTTNLYVLFLCYVGALLPDEAGAGGAGHRAGGVEDQGPDQGLAILPAVQCTVSFSLVTSHLCNILIIKANTFFVILKKFYSFLYVCYRARANIRRRLRFWWDPLWQPWGHQVNKLPNKEEYYEPLFSVNFL